MKEGYEVVKGTPGLVFLPARNYTLKVLEQEHSIVIPSEGKYVDIDPSFFSEEDGYFDLVSENNEVLYAATIQRVLFASKKYPDLKENQVFAPVAMRFNDENIEIIGQVIEILGESK